MSTLAEEVLKRIAQGLPLTHLSGFMLEVAQETGHPAEEVERLLDEFASHTPKEGEWDSEHGRGLSEKLQIRASA